MFFLSPTDVLVRKPTLQVLQRFVTVDDVQPLRVQPLDQGERQQRVGHRRLGCFVVVGVEAGHFCIEAAWTGQKQPVMLSWKQTLD